MFISIARSSRWRWFHLSVVLAFSLFLFSGSSYSFEGRCHDESLIHWYNPENAERIKAGYGVNSITDITLLSSSVFPGDFFDLVYRDGYLYLANGWQNYDGNLKIFDASNPPAMVA